MRYIQDRFGTFVIGFYTWIVSIYFGGVLLDIVYANSSSEGMTASPESADFLLLIAFVTFIAAVGAIIFSWKSNTSRIYFVTSLIILIFEFLIPLFFSQLVQNMQSVGAGPAIRMILNGTASVLAMIGFSKFHLTRSITDKIG